MTVLEGAKNTPEGPAEATSRNKLPRALCVLAEKLPATLRLAKVWSNRFYNLYNIYIHFFIHARILWCLLGFPALPGKPAQAITYGLVCRQWFRLVLWRNPMHFPQCKRIFLHASLLLTKISSTPWKSNLFFFFDKRGCWFE